MDPYRQSWIDLLLAERERRLQARLGAGGDPRDGLLAKLDEMHERMAAAPDYVPPTPAAVAAAECLLLDLLGSRG